MRKKIESLGTDVYVKYEKVNDPVTMPDSTVIFTSVHDIGMIEIIFDFATYERNIIGMLSNVKGSRIEKVSERTYYRRSPNTW